MNRRTVETKDSEATSVRPKRVPIGARPRLSVQGKDPNYEYRIVNDSPGNVDLMKRNGWTVCTNEEVDTGTYRADQATELGSMAYFIVDGGNGMKGYVMKISKEEFQEIMEAYDDIARDKEETLFKPNYNDGEYGSVKIDRSGRR